ncbi:hypothetical protein P175DRAFT_0527672 [Aspergillus ochraceoroseus IBT 24754]|uniref:Uncharacterized protein n=1 Tax=Aspergillus ochraceoroseus IBT 24754 TaxID=1392256 RepID=A0A2T5M6R6_9EURO|nr:uncharacterized protein P175DRAFT_0527672 [Aspergillus ochraceoroseus IBT 24754]PTU24222.1 hypothetical protein P175DRAFT_0527672 [Aspergillus ochraceoroseus IBT 24754]
MSRTPPQQWIQSSDGRYISARTYTSDDESQGLTAISSHPYSTQEPPRFLLPDNQSYDATMVQVATVSRPTLQGRGWDGGNDAKYNFSPASTGSLAQYSIQRSSVSRTVEHAGPSSSYYDASNRSRGSIGSIGRINDVDSQ